MRGRRRDRRAGAAALAAAGVLLAAGAAGAVPAPAVVVEPAPAARVAVAVAPAVTVVPDGAAPGAVTHTVTVGRDAGAGPHRLVLAARTVTAGPDGAPTVTGTVAPGVALPADAVTLDVAEQARLVTRLGEDAPAVLALVAAPEGDPDATVTALVARTAPADGTTVRVELDEDAARVTVTAPADAAGPVVVDLRLRLARPLGGPVVDEVVRDLLVLPGAPRVRRVAIGSRGLPQHLRVVADLARPDGTALDRDEAARWLGEPLTGVAAGAVTSSAVAVTVVLLRRRRVGGPTPG
ncbi:MAG: hypothetical protein ACLGIR_12895 [Actinomycetes bacterium]